MSGDPPSQVVVRRVGPDEWRLVRDLRLDATADPDAAMAFLDSHAATAAHSDEFWRERTPADALSETIAQFVAEVDGDAVGSLSVLIKATGQADHLGRVVDDRRAFVVG